MSLISYLAQYSKFINFFFYKKNPIIIKIYRRGLLRSKHRLDCYSDNIICNHANDTLHCVRRLSIS
jgi:hypothetical protein